MKVWVLMREVPYDGGYIEGIYATEVDATGAQGEIQAAVDENARDREADGLPGRFWQSRDRMTVEAYEVLGARSEVRRYDSFPR